MDRRDRVALAFALAVHAAAVVGARRAAVGAPSPARVELEPSEVAIEIEERPVSASPGPPDELRQRAIAPATVRAAAPSRAAPPAASPVTQETASAIVPPESAPRVSPPSEPPRPSTPLTLAQIGLEGPNPFVTSAPIPPATPTPREAVDGVSRSISESLLKHDRSVGLGSEGPAIAVIEETVLASTAAVNGRAVLGVMADALGVVTGVACLDGDHAQWDAIATTIGNALRGKRLRSAPGGRGVQMRIEVTSREELPSGRDPGLEVRVFKNPFHRGIPLKHGRGPRSSSVDILEVNPRIVIDDPNPDETDGPPTAAAQRFPTAHIEVVKVFALDFDPVDIGAKARRVVHARVLEEHPL
jgi:hypothetical protein